MSLWQISEETTCWKLTSERWIVCVCEEGIVAPKLKKSKENVITERKPLSFFFFNPLANSAVKKCVSPLPVLMIVPFIKVNNLFKTYVAHVKK